MIHLRIMRLHNHKNIQSTEYYYVLYYVFCQVSVRTGGQEVYKKKENK